MPKVPRQEILNDFVPQCRPSHSVPWACKTWRSSKKPLVIANLLDVKVSERSSRTLTSCNQVFRVAEKSHAGSCGWPSSRESRLPFSHPLLFLLTDNRTEYLIALRQKRLYTSSSFIRTSP